MKAILIFLLCIPTLASAKTIVEPSLSLNRGGFSGAIGGSPEFTNGGQAEVSYTTFSAGVRYGITRRYIHVTAIAEGYLMSVDGDVTTGTGATATTTGVETDTEFKANVGLGIGYEWNIPLRTYLIIGFPFSGAEVSYYFSEGFLIGLKYSKMDIDFAGAELSASSYGLTVSFPFEFEYPDHWWRKTDWD